METSKFVGQNNWQKFFVDAINKSRLNHAYLFSGPAHIGKKTFVYDLAQRMLCSDKMAGSKKCGKCSSCLSIRINSETSKIYHIDLVVLEQPLDESITDIDKVRHFIEELSKTPAIGKYRVAIVNNLDKLSQQSLNLLLKTLEEPPSSVIILLVVELVQNLPMTVISRVQHCQMSPVSRNEVFKFLNDLGLDHSTSEELAAISAGRPGLAIRWLKNKNEFKVYKKTAEDFLKLLRKEHFDQFAFTESIAKETQLSRLELLALLQHWLLVVRDILLVSANEPGLIVHRTYISQIEQMTDKGGTQKWINIIRALELAQQRIRRYGNRRLVINSFFIKI